MRIAVLGAGTMVSWLARALSWENDTAVYDVNTERFKDLKGITVLSGLHGIGTFNPDLLINAVSFRNTVTAFEEVTPYISQSCIISDVAVVKSDLADYYGGSPFRYVSVHPMFSPTFADIASLQEESVIIVRGCDREGAQFFRCFFERLKASIVEYSFEEHDSMMAYSLTLPFVSSMAFAASVDGRAVPGTTFAKHLLIASGLLREDEHLLAEILFNPYSLAELDKVTARLEYLKHIIRGRDLEELEAFFQRLRSNLS